MSDTDQRYMALALSLASRGLGRVWPNPAVGCVVVKNNRVIGRGWTAPGGRPHAEPQALAQAGDAARGATVYVSLEPCAHHGKTPPCAEALIAAGVARVVSATTDPDARVAGKGHDMLRAAGIKVTIRVLEDRAQTLNAGFFTRVTQRRPRITLKLANSFDGRIATATGESQWITGTEARRTVHAMRARHDAVMVGSGTARTDDPSLTVRGMGVTHQPVRVVISRRLDLPLDGQLARTAGEVPVWIIYGADISEETRAAWSGTGATLLTLPDQSSRHIDLHAALRQLGDQGLTRVFCEGGGALAASLLHDDLVDDLIGFTAGCTIGAEGMPSIGALGLHNLADAPRFELVDTTRVGGDVMHRWIRRR